MLASVATFALEGVESREVTVEVDLRRGLPAFTVVGLPDAAVREARERVRAALLNSGLEFPLKRVTANLAPADVPKVGPSFDLALALALLAAGEQVPPAALADTAVCGELSLGGEVRPVRGVVSLALGARRRHRRLIVPLANAAEASLIEGIEVLGADRLERIVDLLAGRRPPPPAPVAVRRAPPAREAPDLADVRGQADAKRALEIAAAGAHNLLMVGPPGVGKTMLARRLAEILPPPTFAEAVDVTRVHSVAGLGTGEVASARPFRAPHHTVSASGLVGGGSVPRPGEISLAHHGVLFLDELGEFSRSALEALRQPLEEGRVEVVRGQRALAFPAEVMLVAACNRCPCARAPDECLCTDADRARYRRRLSGPLLDRIDLSCHLEPVAPLELVGGGEAERSVAVRQRVVAARERQHDRLAGTGVLANAAMGPALTRRHVRLGPAAEARLLTGHAGEGLSGRAHDGVLRVARTIADLAGREEVAPEDVDEALGYRAAPPAAVAA